jgi:toxin HigB-1
MIVSFRDEETETVFLTGRSVRFRMIEKVAFRKLRYLDASQSLLDIAQVPGNELEALKYDRQGQHSIRINRQWRLCFVWQDGNAHNVEIADPH